MSDERLAIDTGDKVQIHLASDMVLLEGIVRHVPCAEGDSWIIIGTDSKLYYVQRFEYMVRVQP